jgi:hypothetical protein
LPLALERRRIAHSQGRADLQSGLQQGFATGKMGVNDQFALQKS